MSEHETAAPADRTPSLTDLVGLPVPTAGAVSPDGRRTAYLVSRANWKDDRHEARVFVHDRTTQRTHPLTRSGHASQVRWLGPDALAVLREDFDGCGEGGAQVWLFEGLLGEGWRITDHEGGIGAFEPFAEGILYKAADPKRRKNEERADRFGTLRHQEREASADALYYLGLRRLRAFEDALRATGSEKEREKLRRPVVDLSPVLPGAPAITDFAPSPTGDAVYLTCRARDDLVFLDDTTCYRLGLDPEAALERQLALDAAEDRSDGAEKDGDPPTDHLGTLVRLALPPGAAVGPVSPDGNHVVVRHRVRDRKWTTQSDLFALDVTVGIEAIEAEGLERALPSVTAELDQEPLSVRWCDAGILATVIEGTHASIYLLSPDGPPRRLALEPARPGPFFDVTAGGDLCYVGADAERYQEVYTARLAADGTVGDVARLTDFQAAVAPFELGTVETIRWTSRDGTPIEGVLRRPPGFEPGRRYPLAFVVHGGPSWASRELLLDGDDLRYYPTVALAARGVLVLKPNYRGSLGRGQAFLELNAGNLGVGDLWDLESAIDALDERGLVDPERVVCMGWSQGGYISAMAAIRSDRFRAVSVGAGISDWYTYHVSNDIPQFTTHYLGASPFDDRETYRATAPIEGLSEDAAPTLIQHGAKDQRVPLSNAMELFRGLQAKGVPVELFVYPEMAHPITKPRENRAVLWQNLTWFAHHLFGDELDFFGPGD